MGHNGDHARRLFEAARKLASTDIAALRELVDLAESAAAKCTNPPGRDKKD